MRSMIGMVLACGLVMGAAGDAAAQDIAFKGWAADGRAVLAVDDPFDMLGSGQESFGAACWGTPVDSTTGMSSCAVCQGSSCDVAKKASRAKAKSPDRKVSVSAKRACKNGADGKVCTQTVTVGKLGKFVHTESTVSKAKMQVHFRADSKAVVIIFKANNPESGSGEDAVYVLDLEPVPEVPEYEEPPDWDDPCGNY